MKTLILVPLRRTAAWLALALSCAFVAPAVAQSADDAVDPPDRVGRLADVSGEVWIYDDQEGEWIEAVRNRPITTGDRLSSAATGRAEVRIGSTTLRLDRNTEVEVARLDDQHLVLQLHSGDVAVRLRTRDAAQGFELTTEEGRFLPDRAGSYRFNRDDDATDVIVHAGQVQLRAADAGVTVKAGQVYRFWQQDGTRFELTELRRDDFDDWVAQRDDREERSVSARYVSPEMTGVEDLDRYGRWEQDTQYGALWIPRSVPVGWAPYRVGHWVWISPWGWTWVDDAPWGFAPFHYGRWVMRSSVWCWVPGAYAARPVYAPAVVGWVGAPGVSVGISIGRAPNVGWFPLGPREVYVPGYRYSPHYMRQVNGGHVPHGFDWNPYVRDPRRAFEHGQYRYRDQPGVVTMVPRQVMDRRLPVAPAIIGVSGRPVPGWAPDRPGHGPGVRPPTMGGRPPQAAIPPAPGGGGDRYGAPRFGRDEPRGRWERPGAATPPLPTVVVPAPRPVPQQPQPQPQPPIGHQPQNPRPGFPADDRPGRWQRDDRWSSPGQQGQPSLPPVQRPQPQPQQPPQWHGRPQQPQPQQPQQPPQVQQPLPQNPQWNRRPTPPQQLPPMQQPQPQPPQVQQPQPQPGFGGRPPGVWRGERDQGGGQGQGQGGGQAFPGGGGNDGARHRRMD